MGVSLQCILPAFFYTEYRSGTSRRLVVETILRTTLYESQSRSRTEQIKQWLSLELDGIVHIPGIDISSYRCGLMLYIYIYYHSSPSCSYFLYFRFVYTKKTYCSQQIKP